MQISSPRNANPTAIFIAVVFLAALPLLQPKIVINLNPYT